MIRVCLLLCRFGTVRNRKGGENRERLNTQSFLSVDCLATLLPLCPAQTWEAPGDCMEGDQAIPCMNERHLHLVLGRCTFSPIAPLQYQHGVMVLSAFATLDQLHSSSWPQLCGLPDKTLQALLSHGILHCQVLIVWFTKAGLALLM